MEHIHLETTFSTQEILKEKVRQNGGNYLISTDNQSSGKGRQGSAWEHFETALAFSFNIKPNEVLTLTSLEIGVHLANFFKGKAKLKWPNDLLNDQKEKVGGILCQLMGDQILVGIGLNLKGTPSRPDFPYPIGCILDEGDLLQNDFKKSLPLEIYQYIENNRLSAQQVRNQFNTYCIHNQKNGYDNQHRRAGPRYFCWYCRKWRSPLRDRGGRKENSYRKFKTNLENAYLELSCLGSQLHF